MQNNENDLLKDDKFIWEDIRESLKKQVNDELMEQKDIKRKKKRKKARNRLLIILGTIILLCLVLIISPIGKKVAIHIAGNYIYGKLDVDKDSKYNITKANKREKETSNTINNSYLIKNFLLIGVEEIKGASNTDTMIIASLNTKEKTVKLTSLMRDLYVEIPENDNNKLNWPFSKGGIDLLYETVENNFGVSLDGYVLVNFDSLEDIVDSLDGIEITLTKDEADYLNVKNYISERKNRNVSEGTQVLNGNQVLGYCRVRYVSTGTENNDFGRTQRHRVVLNSIYKEVKKLNVFQVTSFMNKVLSNSNITTDISKDDFTDYLEQSINIIGNINISEYRVPANGTYENQKVLIGKRKQAVLVPKDWNTVRSDIKDYIYGIDN